MITSTLTTELEEQAMAGWVLWPHDPLWDLVDASWFTHGLWRTVWMWMADHRDVPPTARLSTLLTVHRAEALACMEAVARWSDVVCHPTMILPLLRQAQDARRTQAILAEGLQLDPWEQDPGEWTLERLQGELEQRQRAQAEPWGHSGQEGVVALTAQLQAIDYEQGTANAQMLQTGYPALDTALFGLWPEDFVVLGGRPTSGKTTLALNMVRHWCERGTAVGYVSLEMSETSLHAAWAAQHLHWPVQQILSPLNASARHQVHEALDRQYHWPLRVWTAPITAERLWAVARQWARDKTLDVLVVDYLQLMDRPALRSPVDEITALSRSLRNLAKALQIPVLAISSFSRANGDDGEPQLSSLRGSGQIEHDATKVLLTFSMQPVAEDETPSVTDTQMVPMKVRVAKVRQGGRPGVVTLALWPKQQRIESMTRREGS